MPSPEGDAPVAEPWANRGHNHMVPAALRRQGLNREDQANRGMEMPIIGASAGTTRKACALKEGK